MLVDCLMQAILIELVLFMKLDTKQFIRKSFLGASTQETWYSQKPSLVCTR